MKGYKHGGDIYSNFITLDFSVNINPQGIPKGVVDAIVKSAGDCATYPDPLCRKLVSAIALKEGVPEDWIICGNGAADLIFRMVQALFPKRAVLLAPGFSDYAAALRMIDCGIRYHLLKESDNFQLTDSIINSLTKEMDLLILCNPNNPTGQTIKPKLLEKIITHCDENGIFLMVDECFLDFVKNGTMQSLTSELRNHEHLMVLSAFTKFYACAGVRIGYALCAGSTMLESMRQCCQSWPVSIPAQAAGIAALSETEYANNTIELISTERQYLWEELKKLSIKVYPSDANFILFYYNDKLYDKLLKKGILIRNCYNYPGLRFGYFRIAVKRHEENVILIEALQEILEETAQEEAVKVATEVEATNVATEAEALRAATELEALRAAAELEALQAIQETEAFRAAHESQQGEY